MGLDITAYEKVEFVHDDRPTDEEWDLGSVYVHVAHDPWLPTLAPLQPGAYRTSGGIVRFRAGSYSGYSEWRSWLSRAALGMEPEAVWEALDSDRWQLEDRAAGRPPSARPFVELIWFSDCEGSIGPLVSAKLHQDFVEHEDRLRAASVEDEWFIRKYTEWMAAFKLAASGGVVRFH